MRVQNPFNTVGRFRSVSSVISLGLWVCLALGCESWNEFGNGPRNPHNSGRPGPQAGIASQVDLLHPMASTGITHQGDTSVLEDSGGAFYVSSSDPELHVYDNTGAYEASYNLGVVGPNGPPFVDSANHMLYTGAKGGGFYAIEIDKTVSPYTLTLMGTDSTLGMSLGSPKMARDGTLYIASESGEVVRYEYDSATTSLTRLASQSLFEQVPGTVALYDADPAWPDEEVLVATAAGNFYVWSHDLSTLIWVDSSGAPWDQYFAGVTVAERGTTHAPLALLPIAHQNVPIWSPNSGKLRAINLVTRSVEWELTPTYTTPGSHEIVGSVAVLEGQKVVTTTTGGGSTIDPGGVDPNPGGGILVIGGGDIGGTVTYDPGTVTYNPDDPDDNPNDPDDDKGETAYHATFASTDTALYGVDLVTGMEVWAYNMGLPAFDAPVVDRDNIIYVGDGSSLIHGVNGNLPTPGTGLWIDTRLSTANVTDVVRLGIVRKAGTRPALRGLIVGTRDAGYAVYE